MQERASTNNVTQIPIDICYRNLHIISQLTISETANDAEDGTTKAIDSAAPAPSIESLIDDTTSADHINVLNGTGATAITRQIKRFKYQYSRA